MISHQCLGDGDELLDACIKWSWISINEMCKNIMICRQWVPWVTFLHQLWCMDQLQTVKLCNLATSIFKVFDYFFSIWNQASMKRNGSGLLGCQYRDSLFCKLNRYIYISRHTCCRHILIMQGVCFNSLGIGWSFQLATMAVSAPALATLMVHHETQNWCMGSSMLIRPDSSMLCRALLIGQFTLLLIIISGHILSAMWFFARI